MELLPDAVPVLDTRLRLLTKWTRIGSAPGIGFPERDYDEPIIQHVDVFADLLPKADLIAVDCDSWESR